jgi:hypothetical protein
MVRFVTYSLLLIFLMPALALAQAGPSVITFDVPGAGTSAASCLAQGTFPYQINGEGEIGGNFQDANNVLHGFVRAPDGAITVFDAPGAGAGVLQGTFPLGINSKGAVTGYYIDANGVGHGFLRTGRRCQEDGQDRSGNCEE